MFIHLFILAGDSSVGNGLSRPNATSKKSIRPARQQSSWVTRIWESHGPEQGP